MAGKFQSSKLAEKTFFLTFFSETLLDSSQFSREKKKKYRHFSTRREIICLKRATLKIVKKRRPWTSKRDQVNYYVYIFPKVTNNLKIIDNFSLLLRLRCIHTSTFIYTVSLNTLSRRFHSPFPHFPFQIFRTKSATYSVRCYLKSIQSIQSLVWTRYIYIYIYTRKTFAFHLLRCIYRAIRTHADWLFRCVLNEISQYLCWQFHNGPQQKKRKKEKSELEVQSLEKERFIGK